MHSKQQLFQHLLPALQARTADLATLGEQVTVDQLFEYCMENRFRNHPLDALPVHQVVASIFRVTLADLKPSTVYCDVEEDEIRTLLYDVDI